MVSPYTSERFDKAKKRLDEARSKLADAQSEFIDAQRKMNDASRAWEHEFFGAAEKRAAGKQLTD